MKKIIFILALFAIMSFCLAVVQENASFWGFMISGAPECAYDKFITHTSERVVTPNYNLYAPFDRQLTGFGDFVVASEQQLLDWDVAVGTFIDGDYEATEILMNQYGFPYSVAEFYDQDTDRTYYILRETLNGDYDNNNTPDFPDDDEIGSYDYGWGIYIFNPQGQIPAVVHVVHPNDDFTVVPIAVKTFQELDAQYLLIHSAGREVKWTNVAPYTNAKSLSDPSRVEEHPFNKVYQRACDRIRANGQHELSLQIHGYDWGDRHPGYASCQISAGYNKSSPDLPIRDHSSLKKDIINYSRHLMFPENTIGIHAPVYLNDYYGVYCERYDFTFSDDENSYPVNNYIDLPGYSDNQQMSYSQTSNNYDNFEPFFHIEMDELPNCYEQTTNSYHWFYGFNANTNNFDYSHIYDNTMEYYGEWITALAQVVPSMFAMNDNLVPSAVSDLQINGENYNNISLTWSKCDSYDFESYEVLFSTQPIDNGGYSIHNKANNTFLACSSHLTTIVSALSSNQTYYFKVRGKDKNGNYSELSNEVTGSTGAANVTNFRALGNDNRVFLSWTAQYQSNNQGFSIYRSLMDENDYQLVDSWQTNPALVGTTDNNEPYAFTDFGVINGNYYNYKVASTNVNGQQFYHQNIITASPQSIFILNFTVDTLTDTIAFGANPYASDGYDSYYDILKNTEVTGDYILAEFFRNEWDPDREMAQEIMNYFDIDRDAKSWTVRVKTNQTNQPITVSISEDYLRDSRKLYFKDNSTGEMVNLTEGSYTFTLPNALYRTFTLTNGNLLPATDIVSMTNQFFQAGDEVTFSWNTTNNYLVDNISIYLRSVNDSIFIAENLVPALSNYIWSVPDNLLSDQLQFKVRLNLKDGDHKTFSSDYRIGILPAEYDLVFGSGWKMVSNPLTNENNVSSMLGSNSSIYTYFDSLYTNAGQFNFGTAYWLNSPNGSIFSTEAELYKTQYSSDMTSGWNMVANPHLTTYNVNDLRFQYNGKYYSYTEAITYGLLYNSAYYYNEKYFLITDIRPQESFFIYSFVDNISVIFAPFNKSYQNLITNEVDFAATIYARQDEGDEDNVILSLSAITGDEFDMFYDQPEPPQKPMDNYLSLYTGLVTDREDFQKLNVDCRGLLSNEGEDQHEYSFTLQVPDLTPVVFGSENISLPEGYHLLVMFDDNELHNITEGNEFTYQPQSETVQGVFYITNEYIFVDSDDNTVAFKNDFSNYPNPFNPSTTFSFSIKEAAIVQIDIYNLKGQKVTCLVNDRFERGSHQIIWNGKDNYGKAVASGVYFTRIKAGSFEKNRKIMLLK